MDMRMSSGIVAKGLDGKGDAGRIPSFLTRVIRKKLVRHDAAHWAQLAEHVLAIRNGKKDIVLQMAAELNHLLAMT